MSAFWPVIPSGNALFLLALCLLVGAFVIWRYCLDQFEKPSSADENDPWKFVGPRYLTSERQYLLGFSIYCGTIIAVYVAISIIGPGPFFLIMKALAAAATQTEGPTVADTMDVTLQTYPTFPILVAFYIVGFNPHLPKAIDFEIVIRRFAHR